MLKYQFVLHAAECGDFMERLRDLGMVDITTTGWEPSQEDRDLILDVESHSIAEVKLAEFAQSEAYDKGAEIYSSSDEAYAEYTKVCEILAEYDSQIEQLQKSCEEATPWGDFSSESLSMLASEGIKLNYFMAAESVFEAIVAERGDELTISQISNIDGKIYFVVVTREGDGVDVNIDAQLLRPLSQSAKESQAAIAELESAKAAMNGALSRAASSLSLIAEHKAQILSELELSKVSQSAEQAAEGSLLVMEAWAEEVTSSKVDEVLESQSGLVYFKSQPTPDDNTPVKLKNGRYATLFEMISNLYALPKYGTIDLTPFFAPFYMLFFAICLCDAGYGAIILSVGIALAVKGADSMRQTAWLTIVCGATALIFGFLANSFFGMSISSAPLFANFKFIDFQKDFFSASMIIGICQILFGMVINIVVTTRSFGFKYALGTLGWFLMIFSMALSGGVTALGVSGFGFDSIPFYVLFGIGTALLFLCNTPGKNIFVNLIQGVLEVYNRFTGLMGDVLSYIRLFAIGLSGGVLALVFNNLAIGMTGLDAGFEGVGIVSIVVKIIFASLILMVGHGINLFMSSISSFVHPMRLTFVEFYKNAGFEMSSRKFEPLKRG